MAKKKATKKAAPQVNPFEGASPEERARINLQSLHVGVFDKYLQTKYPQGTEGVSQEIIDAQFEAFCCGFNSGIFQSAGEILAIVGVELGRLAKSDKENQDTEKAE